MPGVRIVLINFTFLKIARYDGAPFKPWNDPMRHDDPFAPWNCPFGEEKDYQKYCDENHIREMDR